MKICDNYNHLNAHAILLSKNSILLEVNEIMNDSSIRFGQEKPKAIKSFVNEKFNRYGWADRVKIQKKSNLTISFLKNKVGLCFQIGNVARTYADILKLGYMWNNKSIDVGIILVPERKASLLMGQNYASFERLANEMDLFRNVISSPILIFSLSN